MWVRTLRVIRHGALLAAMGLALWIGAIAGSASLSSLIQFPTAAAAATSGDDSCEINPYCHDDLSREWQGNPCGYINCDSSQWICCLPPPPGG